MYNLINKVAQNGSNSLDNTSQSLRRCIFGDKGVYSLIPPFSVKYGGGIVIDILTISVPSPVSHLIINRGQKK